MVGRKTWIRLFSIYTLVMFMANLFFTRVADHGYSHWADNYPDELYHHYSRIVEQTSVFGIIFFCFAMLFTASGMFSQMKDTRKRSAYLLWPVSNVEKYVVSVLISVVMMLFLTVGAYVLADALRVLVDWLTGRIIVWGFTMPVMGRDGEHPSAVFEEGRLLWMLLVWAFYVHSLYIVGGTLFRRQQFLFASGTIVVVGILLVMLLNQIDYWTVFHFEFITGTWDEKTQTYTKIFHPLFYIINSAMMLLIVFHYWLSYKLFCRMQVINNKWLNV
jgi:hypothetical protein